MSPKTKILIAAILAVACWRIITVQWEHQHVIFSFSPMYALALFAAAYLNGTWKSVLVPLAALFASDVVLCQTVYSDFRVGILYDGWYWVYGAFILITLSAKYILRRVHLLNVALAIVASSVIHLLVSTLAQCVQVTGEPFFSAYANRLVTALPYESKQLTGTLLYCVVLFGSWEMLRRMPRLNLRS